MEEIYLLKKEQWRELCSCIMSGLTWSSTPEGPEFWHTVYNRCEAFGRGEDHKQRISPPVALTGHTLNPVLDEHRVRKAHTLLGEASTLKSAYTALGKIVQLLDNKKKASTINWSHLAALTDVSMIWRETEEGHGFWSSVRSAMDELDRGIKPTEAFVSPNLVTGTVSGVRDWNKLEELHRTLGQIAADEHDNALNNVYHYLDEKLKAKAKTTINWAKMARLMDEAMKWEKTREGLDFWSKLHSSVCAQAECENLTGAACALPSYVANSHISCTSGVTSWFMLTELKQLVGELPVDVYPGLYDILTAKFAVDKSLASEALSSSAKKTEVKSRPSVKRDKGVKRDKRVLL